VGVIEACDRRDVELVIVGTRCDHRGLKVLLARELSDF
jgi:hypothetical protein